MFEERAILRKDEEEQKVSETWKETISQPEKETMASQRLFQDNIAGQDTGRSIPSRTAETIPVAWSRHFNFSLAVSRKGKPFAECGEEPFAR